jgi:ATP-binding cassette subfamily F protein 3
MRIALSKILLQAPDLLLLDEPTNYLDLESLIWLESFLANYPGAMIIVSHDRAFLNHLVDRIAEIEGERIDVYHGDYDHYLEEKESRNRILEATYKTQQRKIEQTERFIERFRAKNTKSSQVQSRIKMLEKIERIEIPKERKEVRFRFPAPQRSGHRVVGSRTCTSDTVRPLSIRELISRSSGETRWPWSVPTEPGNRRFSRSWPEFSILKKGR